MRWDCSSPCYDANFLPKGGAVVENQYVSIGFEPFFSTAEQKAVPMVKNYVKYTGASKASGFGVIGFSGGAPYAVACGARFPHRLTGVVAAGFTGPYISITGP